MILYALGCENSTLVYKASLISNTTEDIGLSPLWGQGVVPIVGSNVISLSDGPADRLAGGVGGKCYKTMPHCEGLDVASFVKFKELYDGSKELWTWNIVQNMVILK